MIIKKPKFWDQKKPNFFAYLLIPLSKIVTIYSLLKNKNVLEFPNIRTICVGNIYIGGTGKTPLSIKISELLNSKGIKTTVLKKFYSEQKDEQLLIKSRTNLISKRSRKDCSNSIFFAIKGENFNGNIYAEEAIQKGALMAVVDDEKYKKNDKYIVVRNSLRALQKIAEKHKNKSNFEIIAITGTNGKTTTKMCTEHDKQSQERKLRQR